MIQQFNLNNIWILKKLGYEVEVACNFEKGNTCPRETIVNLKKKLTEQGVLYFQIDFSRKVYDVKTVLHAYRQVCQLVKNRKYNVIHCQSPIGGAIGRIVGNRFHIKVLYTAHGFHFYTGAPLINWILYYPIEKYLSRYTELLITINTEDYKRTKSFHSPKVEHIPGVGIDISRIQAVKINKKDKRKELGVPENAIMLLSVGELNKNKNHKLVIEAMTEMQNKSCYYIVCGKGAEKAYLMDMAARVKIRDRVKLLGFREDVIEIAKCADIFVFPSKREGLGLAALEAMACGLPLITSNVHGINDYSFDGITGYKVCPYDVKGLAEKIDMLSENADLREKMANTNKKLSWIYDVKNINERMKNIYKLEVGENEN